MSILDDLKKRLGLDEEDTSTPEQRAQYEEATGGYDPRTAYATKADAVSGPAKMPEVKGRDTIAKVDREALGLPPIEKGPETFDAAPQPRSSFRAQGTKAAGRDALSGLSEGGGRTTTASLAGKALFGAMANSPEDKAHLGEIAHGMRPGAAVPAGPTLSRQEDPELRALLNMQEDVRSPTLSRTEDPELRGLLNASEKDPNPYTSTHGTSQPDSSLRPIGLNMARGAAEGPPPSLSPSHGTAKALLAKMRPPTGDTPQNPMGTVAEGPPAPEAPAVAAGGIPGAVQQAMMGAHPNAAPAPAEDALKAAQDAAEAGYNKSSLVDQLNSATDSIAGTHLAANHTGDAMRQHGQQGVKDVIARDDRQMAHEDQGFQRDANARAQSADQRAGVADQRAATTFQAGREMDMPGTRQAKSYEAVAMGLYPEKVRNIPAAQRAQMSANDWKAALGELQQQKPVGTGGGAAGARGLAQLSKLLPPETANVYAGVQRVKDLVQKGGGWDKVEGTGLLGGFTPGFMMSENGSALRSEIGNLAGIYLQSKGGKAITHTEEGIILGKIRANPKGVTPDELQQGMAIIGRNSAGNVRQGLAPLPRDQAEALLESAGIPKEWAFQSGTAPTRAAPPPARKLVRLKSGEVVEQAD